jgi:hypothetical protein
MIDKNYVGSWEICFGYCTGNPLAGNDSWFTTKQIIHNETLGKALFEARKAGYKVSDDVCADFLFNVKDVLNGQFLDEVDTSIAMTEATKLLFDETE